MDTPDRKRDLSLDPHALGADVRRVLREFIARRVGDPHTADDLTQDVLLKAYRSGTNLGDLDDVAAWLYRIARNTVVDHFRARDRRPEPELLGDHEHVGTHVDDDGAVRDLAQCLRPLIDRLEPMYRDALTLTELDGLTQTEAGQRTGISTSGMKSRVQRARMQLRRALLECCAVHTDGGGHIAGFTSRNDCCQRTDQ